MQFWTMVATAGVRRGGADSCPETSDMHVRRSMPLAALAVAVLTGHLTDRTTGQPLTGVTVVASGARGAKGMTNDDGAYTLRGLPPGKYRITVQSDDVPPQTFAITVGKAAKQLRDFIACSTTLDYSCAAGL